MYGSYLSGNDKLFATKTVGPVIVMSMALYVEPFSPKPNIRQYNRNRVHFQSAE